MEQLLGRDITRIPALPTPVLPRRPSGSCGSYFITSQPSPEPASTNTLHQTPPGQGFATFISLRFFYFYPKPLGSKFVSAVRGHLGPLFPQARMCSQISAPQSSCALRTIEDRQTMVPSILLGHSLTPSFSLSAFLEPVILGMGGQGGGGLGALLSVSARCCLSGSEQIKLDLIEGIKPAGKGSVLRAAAAPTATSSHRVILLCPVLVPVPTPPYFLIDKITESFPTPKLSFREQGLSGKDNPPSLEG